MSKELLKAVKEGDLNTVMKLLQDKSINVNCTVYDDETRCHCTPLALAAKYGHLEVVIYLWENFKEIDRNNCLHAAILGGHLDIVSYLLENANPKDDFVTRYSQNKPELDWIFRFVFHSKSIKILDYFCKNYPLEIYKKIAKSHRFDSGWNLLHYASYSSNREAIKYLLTNYKFDINKRADDRNCSTAFMIAAEKGNIECLKALIEINPSLDISPSKESGESSILHIMINYYTNNPKIFLEMIVFLTNKYPELPKIKNKDGLTPLYYAIHARPIGEDYTSVEIMKTLYNIHPSDEALYFANYFNDNKCVAWILEQGVYIDDKYHKYEDQYFKRASNATMPNSEKLTIEEWSKKSEKLSDCLAAAYKLFQIAEMDHKELKEKELQKTPDIYPKKEIIGRGVNGRRHRDNNTALHVALTKPKVNTQLVIYLIEAGANLFIPNLAGQICLKLLADRDEPLLKALGCFLGAFQLLKNISKNENFDQMLAKYSLDEDIYSEQEINNTTNQKSSFVSSTSQSSQESSMKDLITILKCMRKAFEESYKIENPSDRNYFCFKMGSALAEFNPEEHSPFPVEAFQLLEQVDKNSENYIKAKQIQYKLVVSGQLGFKRDENLSNLSLSKDKKPKILSLTEEDNAEEDNFENDSITPVSANLVNFQDPFQRSMRLKLLIQFALLGNIKDAPLSQYVSEYALNSENSINGIPGFIDFSQPEFCIVIIEKMRSENLKLKAVIDEKDKEIKQLKDQLSQANISNAVSEISNANKSITLQFNSELLQMKKQLDELYSESIASLIKGPKLNRVKEPEPESGDG